MPDSGGTAGGTTTVIIPDSFKNNRETFIQDTAAKLFVNIDFKTVGKSIKECAEESKRKAEALADVLGL